MLYHAEHSNGFINSKPGPKHWDWTSLRREALAEARRVLRDESQAQDAAQEALIRAWRYSAGCADRGHPCGQGGLSLAGCCHRRGAPATYQSSGR